MRQSIHYQLSRSMYGVDESQIIGGSAQMKAIINYIIELISDKIDSLHSFQDQEPCVNL